jgi:hypothetical protein
MDKTGYFGFATFTHDHLGVGKPDSRGDAIYNGALDNGAGDAQVLAIARAFKALPVPPRRSILILFPAAEEQGLLGSRYFAENPPVPAGLIAADVNYDCGNKWGPTCDITEVGLGKSSVDEVAARVAAWQRRTIKPDPFPDRGSFYRSDQFSFAKVVDRRSDRGRRHPRPARAQCLQVGLEGTLEAQGEDLDDDERMTCGPGTSLRSDHVARSARSRRCETGAHMARNPQRNAARAPASALRPLRDVNRSPRARRR